VTETHRIRQGEMFKGTPTEMSLSGSDLGNNLASLAIGDRSELQQQISVFEFIHEDRREEIRSLIENSDIRTETRLLAIAANDSFETLVTMFKDDYPQIGVANSRLLARAIVAFRNNPGHLLLFRYFLSSLSSPFSRTNFNSSSNIEW
jgi:hypothetical protein